MVDEEETLFCLLLVTAHVLKKQEQQGPRNGPLLCTTLTMADNCTFDSKYAWQAANFGLHLGRFAADPRRADVYLKAKTPHLSTAFQEMICPDCD